MKIYYCQFNFGLSFLPVFNNYFSYFKISACTIMVCTLYWAVYNIHFQNKHCLLYLKYLVHFGIFFQIIIFQTSDIEINIINSKFYQTNFFVQILFRLIFSVLNFFSRYYFNSNFLSQFYSGFCFRMYNYFCICNYFSL